MSKISLKPNASGTGVFSLEAPNSNVDRTLTLPDEEGTVATIENIPPGYEDQDALDLFNVTGAAPVYACRAWVNFNATNDVIRDSGNVSSISDLGTGIKRVNFITNMPDANYAAVGGSGEGTSTDFYSNINFWEFNTDNVGVNIGFVTSNNDALNNRVENSVAIFR